MKRVLIALALSASFAAAGRAQQAQQPQPPKTLAEANLIIAQDQQQIAEMGLRISELEAAFTSTIAATRQRLAGSVEAAQSAVQQEQAVAAEAKAKTEADAKAKAAPSTVKH